MGQGHAGARLVVGGWDRVRDVLVGDVDVGGGAGRALINAVYDAADAKGATRTYWATQEFNYKGRMLYDKVADKSPFIQYRRPA